MKPAGGQLNTDPNLRKPSVVDGKSRLFGMVDENEYGAASDIVSQNGKNGGKRVLPSSGNSYHNVIGGSYVAG